MGQVNASPVTLNQLEFQPIIYWRDVQ